MSFLENIFVSSEVAQKLKEICFDEFCLAYYNTEDNDELYFIRYCKNSDSIEGFSAPTYEQVFKWFRSKLMCCKIESYHNSSWGYQIETINKGYSQNDFKTYEEAREQLILKLIEIYKIKNKYYVKFRKDWTDTPPSC